MRTSVKQGISEEGRRFLPERLECLLRFEHCSKNANLYSLTSNLVLLFSHYIQRAYITISLMVKMNKSSAVSLSQEFSRKTNILFLRQRLALFLLLWSLHTSMRHLAALVYLRFVAKLHLTYTHTHTHTHTRTHAHTTKSVDRKIIFICYIFLFVNLSFRFSLFFVKKQFELQTYQHFCNKNLQKSLMIRRWVSSKSR